MIAMGKRRGSNERYCAGGGGDASVGEGCAGSGVGASKSGKFSVFEFDHADMRAETESRKTLARFGTKSPTKKATHFRQPIDKYLFLECFARGTMGQQNHFESQMSHADFALRDFECSSCGANSHAQEKMDSGGYTSGRNPNKVLCVLSDEDECMPVRSSTSFNLAEDEGLLEEQSSDYGKNSKYRNCVQEEMVVVDPKYVKYGNRYYTRCLLTFSQKWIKLEGSPLCDGNLSCCLEWSTMEILKIECQQCESVGADVMNLLFQPKDMNATETGNRNSGCVELEFVVLNSPHWSKKQEEIKSLDLKYKAAWKTVTSICSFNESFEDIIYPDGDPDAVLISRGDIELLQPRTFINDTLIDFYIKYLQTKTKPEELHRFHFFNTFFFPKLVNMDRDSCRTWNGREAFHRVRKWTKNVNLFEKDYIFMPVNFSFHWSLIVICHLGEVANLRDNYMDDSCKVPCILHMDSIRGSHRGLENHIRSYLCEEWKERWNKDDKHLAMKFLNLDFFAPELPQQENLFDCGLFLLHYAELFLEQASNINMPTKFDFLNKDWFHPAEVSLKKRDHIRNLIHRIVEDKTLKNPSAACEDKHQTDIIEGDENELSVQENGVNELCHGINPHSHDDYYESSGQQRSANFLADENCEHHKQLVPINQFSNMRFPVEKGIEKRGAVDRRSRSESGEDPDWACGSFRREEKKLSATSCSESGVKYYAGERERYDISSEEDLLACIVEDSEEECVIESSRRCRTPSSLISPN